MDVTPRSRPDDPESPDAEPIEAASASEHGASHGGSSGLDVTPATARHAESASGTRRGSLLAVVGVAAVVVGLGLVLFNGLRDASTFFYNVDEAVDRRQELGSDRFRMQGNVVDGTVEETADGVRFVIRFDGVEVPVDHTGDPPELFGPKIPVVLEGSFVGERFASDEIMVRHDNAYDEENPDRIREAERDAEREAEQQSAGSGGTG